MTSPIVIDIEVSTPAVGIEISTPAVDVAPDPGGAQAIVIAVPGPPGPPGSGTAVIAEIPGGIKDGTNVTFTLAHTPNSGTTTVYRNGLRETNGVGYTVSGPTIIFGTPPLSSDDITADYLLEG